MKSIQRHLRTRLLTVFTILVVTGAGGLYWAVRSALLEQFDAGLRVKAMTVVTSATQRRGDVDEKFSDKFLREFDDDVATDFFQLWQITRQQDGREVTTVEGRSDSLVKGDLPLEFGPIDAPVYGDLILPVTNKPGRAIGVRFTPRYNRRDEDTANDLREAIVVVASDRSELDTLLARIGGLLLAGGVVVLGVTMLVVPALLRPGLRPLHEVGELASQIDARTLTRRFPVADVPAELQPICERLNDLLQRLEYSFERERRFSGDLAHELLTPLTELRVLTESSVKWPETAGPRRSAETLTIIERMEADITSLLELSRAEHQQVQAKHEQVDLGELVGQIWASYASRALDRKLDVELAGPQSASVATDPVLFRLVVGNLMANAVDYAPVNSPVTVEWDVVEQTIAVSVTNLALELLPEDVPCLFDRFWRKDAARSENHHSGLGLSLAAGLAEVLGGRVDANLAETGELTMTFTQMVGAEPAGGDTGNGDAVT